MAMKGIRGQLVSVIIPVYNRTGLLREAVQSALAQTYRPIEVIIVDDGSTDAEEMRQVAALAAETSEVARSIHVSNRGPGLARQAGLEVASGNYIQFLDSDDLLLPRKLELQVAGLEANPDCALSYGKTREYRLGEVPRAVPTRRIGQRHGTLFPAALQGLFWATETPLFRLFALQCIGSWSGLRVLEDWEYECRLGAQGVKLHYCDDFVSDHRHHAAPREGLRWQRDEQAFRDLLTAHVQVLGHARAAGAPAEAKEMKHFARNLFRLARQAGVRGLTSEAKRLLGLAAWAELLAGLRRREQSSAGASR